MHYHIYGNYDQVYACWEITDFVYKKMLGYRSIKNSDQETPKEKKHPYQKENYWEIVLNSL